MKTSFVALCLGVLPVIYPGLSNAAPYPAEPIRIVVPFGAGSSTDTLSRGVAKGLGERLGQPVVIENRPGAGGNIGSSTVARARPDGYTLVMATNGPFAANASLYRKLPYDPIKDFKPVALMGRLPMVLVANATAPSSSLQELIEESQAKPDAVNLGASNTTARVWAELLKTEAKANMTTVQYSNVGGMMTDLMSGQIQYAFENIGPSLPLIKSGKLKAIAVTSEERAPFLPDTPTIAESNIRDPQLVVWFALFAPEGTPKDVVARLNTEVNHVLATAEMAKLAEQIGMKIAGGTPNDLAVYHKSEVAKWRTFVDITGIHID